MSGPANPHVPYPTHKRGGSRRPNLPCALCGGPGRLTKTHFPPRAVGNTGTPKLSATQNHTLVLRERSATAGLWCWGLCTECHQSTSPWDDEFIRFTNIFAGTILKSPLRGTRSHIEGLLSRVRPGRFARSAFAGLIGWADGLSDSDPDLVASVRTGDSLTTDPEHRLLLGIVPATDAVAVHAGHLGVAVSTSTDGPLPVASVAIHFPPFSFVIAPASAVPRYPHVDITDWFHYSAEEKAHDLPIAIPAVGLRTPSPWTGIALPNGYETVEV